MRRAVVCAGLVLLLVACTAADDVSPEDAATATPDASEAGAVPVEAQDDGLVVLDLGAEPRVRLASTEALRDAVVAVRATIEAATTADGTIVDASAVYDLALTLEDDGDGGRALLAVPTITGTSLPGGVPDGTGTFAWAIDTTGTVLSTTADGWSGAVGPRLRDLLSFSHLVLEVPGAAVGPGARWHRDTGRARTSVTVDAVDDAMLTATVTVVSSGEGAELSVTSTGTWERATLVAQDVVTTSTARASREVVVDGEPMLVEVTQEDRRELQRVPS